MSTTTPTQSDQELIDYLERRSKRRIDRVMKVAEIVAGSLGAIAGFILVVRTFLHFTGIGVQITSLNLNSNGTTTTTHAAVAIMSPALGVLIGAAVLIGLPWFIIKQARS